MVDRWENIPDSLKTHEIKVYYDCLTEKRGSFVIKRVFDLMLSFVLLILFGPLFLLITVIIKLDSQGPAFYLQKRVTKNNEDFLIYKFRTMVPGAEEMGTQVTVSKDPRITKVGTTLRKYRLDELPQLVNIFKGDMTFVGTRPEVRKYVDAYTDSMKATLLLPAGVTSLASVLYKDEQKQLDLSTSIDHTYIQEILPEKMKYNLDYLKKFSLKEDIKILLLTLMEVFVRR